MTHNTDIPSGRIRFALEALEKAEASEFIEVDMGTFRQLLSDRCIACLGGSAWLKAEGADLTSFSSIILATNRIDNNLNGGHAEMVNPKVLGVADFECVINAFREGDVGSAFVGFGLEYSKGFEFDRVISEYEEDPVQFKADLNTLADDLEKAGY